MVKSQATAPLSPLRTLPGVAQKRSQMLSPRPSSATAPSSWYEAEETPQRKLGGKAGGVGVAHSCPPNAPATEVRQGAVERPQLQRTCHYVAPFSVLRLALRRESGLHERSSGTLPGRRLGRYRDLQGVTGVVGVPRQNGLLLESEALDQEVYQKAVGGHLEVSVVKGQDKVSLLPSAPTDGAHGEADLTEVFGPAGGDVVQIDQGRRSRPAHQ